MGVIIEEDDDWQTQSLCNTNGVGQGEAGRRTLLEKAAGVSGAAWKATKVIVCACVGAVWYHFLISLSMHIDT